MPQGRGPACMGLHENERQLQMPDGSSGSLLPGGGNKNREGKYGYTVTEVSPKAERPGPDTAQESRKAVWRK